MCFLLHAYTLELVRIHCQTFQVEITLDPLKDVLMCSFFNYVVTLEEPVWGKRQFLQPVKQQRGRTKREQGKQKPKTNSLAGRQNEGWTQSPNEMHIGATSYLLIFTISYLS